MAAGLAASVEREFGVALLLREGHEGIMEMTVDGRVVYTNHSECGVVPKAKQIFALIEEHTKHTRRTTP